MRMLSSTWQLGFALFLVSTFAQGADIVVLDGGESWSGTILNKSFLIQTSYGKVQLDSSTVTEVRLTGRAGEESIIRTSNGTRISGVLDEPHIILQSDTNGEMRIPCERVQRVTYGKRKVEPYKEGHRYFFMMTNGDYFSGRILDESLTVVAKAEAKPGSLREMRSITVDTKPDQETWVTILNGDELKGLLKMEDIALVMEATPQITLYDNRSSNGRANCAASGKTMQDDPLHLIRMGESYAIGYCMTNKAEGVWVRNVSAGLPASVPGMKVGDWFVSIDCDPVAIGRNVIPLRNEITAGARQHVLLEFSRGDKAFWYLLVK